MNPSSKLTNSVQVEDFQLEGWTFISTKSGIFTSVDNDMLSDLLILQGVPDIVFGNNIGVMMNVKHKFAIMVNAKDALYLCNYDNRSRLYIDLSKQGETKRPNHSSIIPSDVKLKHSQQWSNQHNNPDIKVKELDRISDTFYSTPYMGSVVNDQQLDFWFRKFQDIKQIEGKPILEGQLTQAIVKNDTEYLKQVFNGEGIRCELTTDEIPLSNLTESNPILWATQIPIFEDELGDNGMVNCEFRFRVMKDCFFGLLRSYLRVDDVIIRIYDTRLYHDFKWGYVLREFTAREATWAQLAANGFKVTPQWSVDPQQSYLIQNYIPIVHNHREKLHFI